MFLTGEYRIATFKKGRGDRCGLRLDPAPVSLRRRLGARRGVAVLDIRPVLRRRTSHRLTRAVYEAVRAEGIEIPLPQRVVTMANGHADVDDTVSTADGVRSSPEDTSAAND